MDAAAFRISAALLLLQVLSASSRLAGAQDAVLPLPSRQLSTTMTLQADERRDAFAGKRCFGSPLSVRDQRPSSGDGHRGWYYRVTDKATNTLSRRRVPVVGGLL